MNRSQIKEIQKYLIGNTVKVIDEGFEKQIIIWTKAENGCILEWIVPEKGDMTFFKAYSSTTQVQKEFNEAINLEQYLKIHGVTK